MSNRLPEKLHLLRTSSGLTQSEIASRLMVPVAEYMNWENGNSIPGIDQLKQIALLFHVDLAALLDNTMTFVAPVNIAGSSQAAEGSATIPFASDASATQTLGDTRRFDTPEAAETTKQLNTAELSDVKEDHDLGEGAHTSHHHEDEEEEREKARAKRPASASRRRKKKKKSTGWIFAVCAAAAVIAIAAFILLKHGSSSSNSIGTNNRLILTDTYSLYLEDDGSLKGLGSGYSEAESALKDCVQISAYSSDLAAGLKKNGTVVTTGSVDTSGWSDIKSIAAGADHVVGLKDDGTVVCAGNASACEVSDWSDVKAVYAGNGVTVALKSDGSFLSSGGVGIPDVTGVKAAALSDDMLYYIASNGAVKTVTLTSGASALSTSSLSGVKSLAASTQILAGLNANGTVKCTADDDIKDAVAGWKNVSAIAVNGNTIIGVTKNGKMYGAGTNTYGQYENTADTSAEKTAEPSASATASAAAEPLGMVSNVKFNATTQTLQISWDPVANADYYTVSISPDIGRRLAKITSTSVSVPASYLTSGTTYTIFITAHANNSSKYADSDACHVIYTYEDKTIQLDTPGNIKGSVDSGGAWTISWDRVNNADSYTITIDGTEMATINQTYYTISRDRLTDLSGSVTVGVTAHSSDEGYTDSEAGIQALTYTYNDSTWTDGGSDNGSEDTTE
ncbi:MAG: helix-turn-helix domain-containing protein [Erysipelotrichaceae bacterium]|jgi:transcriptional regulator with XRE-family HTH domain